jgi:hypothetical protein
MNIGRNDPCNCGSGKKYKKCCLLQIQPDQGEFLKKKWSAVQAGLAEKIIKHAEKHYDENALDFAFDEFMLWESEDGFDPHSIEIPIFMPWFFYEWVPDLEIDSIDGSPDIPPALSLAKSGHGISADEKNYLIKCCETSFSFFEVLDVNPGKSLTLKDVLTEDLHLVLEKNATQNVKMSDLFFGKVIEIEGIEILEACSPIIIRPEFKIQILELKNDIKKLDIIINQDILHEWSFEVLELYRFIFQESTNPQMPTLQNTDGDLMIPHKLTFEIEDPELTFEAIYPLCIFATKNELLQDAKYDPQGKLVSIEFPWLKKGNKKNKGWDNTVLGHITINKNKMKVEVNSKERAKKFQAQLKKLMPNGWKLKSTVIESIESSLKKIKTNPTEKLNRKKEQERFMENPEVREHLEKIMKAHWDNWIFEPVPALGGLKPIEAVKTKDGREMVNSLLTQFERDVLDRPVIGQTVEVFRSIRNKLGIN